MRPQTDRLPSRNQEACRSAFRRSRSREDPRHFPSAVSLRRPFASACPPCRSTLMQALTPSAYPFACACARPLRSVGCRPQGLGRHPRSPQSPLGMHWRSPRRGTLRQTRLVFALHPSPPKTVSPASGQGCPAFRPDSRFSPVAAEPSLRKRRRKSRLQERVALRRHPGSRAVAAEFARRPTPS